MRAVRFTGDLYVTSRKRLASLKMALPSRPIQDVTSDLDRLASFVTIEAMNSWAAFSRALYFSTCRGAYQSPGQRLTTAMTFTDDQAALRTACARFKPHLASVTGTLTHREEPNWLDPNTLLTLLTHIGASNAGDFGAALSFQGRVLGDLPTVRNFYAHRAFNTVEKVRRKMVSYGFYNLHPSEFCFEYERNSTQSVIRNWLDELDLVQELAVV